nr:MAG TPA: hypothetical protein [Caudoviricetes sp.]DAX72735.1 MAG TPA: hypothetical protein [Caudoviricetes sp.]
MQKSNFKQGVLFIYHFNFLLLRATSPKVIICI